MAERRGRVFALQAVASVAVLVGLVRGAELGAVVEALRGASPAWLLVAVLTKSFGLLLHELRLWVSLLPYRRPPVGPVIAIGFAAGLLNTVLPVRGGDLVAAALLRSELDLPGPQAVAAVGITGFLEAATFGVFLMGVMVAGAARWEELLGAAASDRARSTLSVLILGAIFGCVILVLLARALRGRESSDAGPLSLLRDTVLHTGEGLSALGPMALNVAMSALQVLTVVGSFWAILPALGLYPPLPLLAVSGVIAVGALAAVVLPPSLGAGPAASAVFVLAFFGVDEAHALSFAALSWVANSVPPLVLGLQPLLGRVGRIGALLRASRED